MDRTELEALLARVERAEGPDREIDLLLWAAKENVKLKHFDVGVMSGAQTEVRAVYENDDWKTVAYSMNDCDGSQMRPSFNFEPELPFYTDSIDAAVALVGEKLGSRHVWSINSPSYNRNSQYRSHDWQAHIWSTQKGCGFHQDHKSSGALALCAALLTALIAEEAPDA